MDDVDHQVKRKLIFEGAFHFQLLGEYYSGNASSGYVLPGTGPLRA
jgi:hypothetical protein